MGFVQDAHDASENTDTIITNQTGVGTSLVLKKTITSSSILHTGPITLATANGEVIIEKILMKTDGTGLAGGTNLNILTNNTKGALTLAAAAISGLGANVSLDAAAAGVTAFTETSLENGKLLELESTVANCTGSGTIDFLIFGRRVTAGASLS